jgi:FkbM family methyltransferase
MPLSPRTFHAGSVGTRAAHAAARFTTTTFHRLRLRLPRRPPKRPIGQVIFEFARAQPAAFVVQIGAHDGTALDPLRDEIIARRWAGILLEPVPYVFERLRATYGRNQGLILENAAIADHDGTQEFHFLREAPPGAEVWEWYDALGSFRRDVVLSHGRLIPDIDDRLASMRVPCLTFDTVCRKHGVRRVDVVQIDTEGYDYEVLKLIDYERYQPQLVMYEHLHFDDATTQASHELLTAHGYTCISDGMDTLGVHERALARYSGVRDLWHRLQDGNLGNSA